MQIPARVLGRLASGSSGQIDKKIASILATALISIILFIPLSYAIFIHKDGPVSRILTPRRFDVARLEQRAYPLFYSGDLKRAKPELEAIVEKAPRNIRARLLLGNACARTGEIEKAIEQFKKVLAINPMHDEAYANLGAIHERQGASAVADGKGEEAMLHFLEAEENYKKALANLKEKKKSFLDSLSIMSRIEKVDKSIPQETKRELYTEAIARMREEKSKLK